MGVLRDYRLIVCGVCVPGICVSLFVAAAGRVVVANHFSMVSVRGKIMYRNLKISALLFFVFLSGYARAEIEQGVIDIQTRSGVSQRLLVMAPAEPKATVILFAEGHGGLQIAGEDSFKWGKGNFLIRSREIFKDQGLLVIVVDAPSDRQSEPYLSGFRQTPEHVMDVKAVIAWAGGRQKYRFGWWGRAEARNRLPL